MGQIMSVQGQLDFERVRSQFIANPCARTAADYHNVVSELLCFNAIDRVHAMLMSRETLAWSLGVKRNARKLPAVRYRVIWWDMCLTIESEHAIVAIYCGTCVVRGATIHINPPVDLRGLF